MFFHQLKYQILFPCIWTSTTLPASTSFKKLEKGSEFLSEFTYLGLETY